ncbi:MAG: LysR family transcriptional regulator [Pseudomonadales bacterium]|nr:LysR family transcriptional regulator [Pseudomonadales bacterium]
MQYRKTPPIQFIPIFEAAARHLSFKKAAQELCVTAPAVGQQIKAFEQWLGKPLFHRHARHLSLTPEGKYYAEVARNVVKAHSQGYTDYTRRFNKSSLHLSAPLFIAQELIMPNYLQFKKHVANTELRVEARMSHVDFDVEPIDAAIRFGSGEWSNLDCRLLCAASVAPVCSQSYADKHDFTVLEELYKHRLIYAEPAMMDWGTHFWHNGATQEYDNIICDSYLAALKAASDGLGVALGIFPTANTWVNSDRLILPFPVQVSIEMGYWMVTPKREENKSETDALYCWLQQLFNDIPTINRPISELTIG